MDLFAHVYTTDTKSILIETDIFSDNLLHHEERAKFSSDNLPNFNNPLVSNIEEENDN